MMNSPQRIGSLYVETNLSATSIASLLEALHRYFEFPSEAEVIVRHTKRDPPPEE